MSDKLTDELKDEMKEFMEDLKETRLKDFMHPSFFTRIKEFLQFLLVCATFIAGVAYLSIWWVDSKYEHEEWRKEFKGDWVLENKDFAPDLHSINFDGYFGWVKTDSLNDAKYKVSYIDSTQQVMIYNEKRVKGLYNVVKFFPPMHSRDDGMLILYKDRIDSTSLIYSRMYTDYDTYIKEKSDLQRLIESTKDESDIPLPN